MFRLFSLVFSIAGVTCAGMAIVVALVLGHDTVPLLLTYAALGSLAGVVASWIIARQLIEQ